MKKWTLHTLLMAMLVLVLAACGSNDSTNSDKKSGNNESAKTESSDSTYPITISPTIASAENEEAGTIAFDDVTFEEQPKKMVVFDYGFLDTLDALGVEGVVGVAKDSTLPDHLSKYESDEYTSVGTLKEPLLEDIAALEPDAIFISGRQSAFYDQLKEITPNVVFVGTDSADYWNTFRASVDVAAELFDKEEEAKEHIGKIESAIEDLKTLAGEYDNTLVTMYNEGKLSGFGSDSRFGYIYTLYGFKPVTEDIDASSHGSNVGFEAILELDPQVLFVIDRTAATGDQSNISKDMENEIIKKTQAYKNDKIIYLDGPLWYLGGGGLQSELAKIEELQNKLNSK
ncbi:MAG: siderophore ABC transporter substrate-binding protein [Bacillus sp. (in: firmicutes)]